jgi:hypothetical protein
VAKVLSIAEFVAKNDTKFQDVPMPEWGEDVVIRLGSLPAKIVVDFSDHGKTEEDKKVAAARMIAPSLVEEDGTRHANPETLIPVLMQKSLVTLNKLVDVVLDLNGLGDKKRAEAKNG